MDSTRTRVSVVTDGRRSLDRDDFVRMNLPEEFWSAKILKVPEAVRELVTKYLFRIQEMQDRGRGLLLHGGIGVGKTGVAACVAKHARSLGKTVFFTTIWELREAARSKVMFEDNTSVLDRCRTVDVLVLDGLREEDGKERYVSAREIEELIMVRGSRKKVTVVTTRLAPDLFDKNFPGLRDAAEAYLAELDIKGPNQRQQQLDELDSL